MASKLADRFGRSAFAILVGFDQLLQTVLVAPLAIMGLAPVPDPDATISGVLGRAVIKQRLWARIPAVLLDALFLVLTLGQERNHCLRTANDEARKCPMPR